MKASPFLQLIFPLRGLYLRVHATMLCSIFFRVRRLGCCCCYGINPDHGRQEGMKEALVCLVLSDLSNELYALLLYISNRK